METDDYFDADMESLLSDEDSYYARMADEAFFGRDAIGPSGISTQVLLELEDVPF